MTRPPAATFPALAGQRPPPPGHRGAGADRGSTRTPPPTRSPCCWVGHRSHAWWSRCSRGRGATRTSASCWYGAATWAPPSCPRTCPMSSARRCWRPGGALSATSREIARILAIAGRPAELRTLAAVAAELGVSDAGSVREAVDAGVMVLGGGEGVWFRHPLLAACWPSRTCPARRPRCTRRGRPTSSRSPPRVSRSCAVSATSPCTTSMPAKASAAFTALLRGADLAEKLGAPREAADLLARAADLWEVAADATDTVGHAQLLERAGEACAWVGRAQESYRLLRAARDLVSPERDPLWASMLTRWVAEPHSPWRDSESPRCATSRGAVQRRPGQRRARRSPGPSRRLRVVGRAD